MDLAHPACPGPAQHLISVSSRLTCDVKGDGWGGSVSLGLGVRGAKGKALVAALGPTGRRGFLRGSRCLPFPPHSPGVGGGRLRLCPPPPHPLLPPAPSSRTLRGPGRETFGRGGCSGGRSSSLFESTDLAPAAHPTRIPQSGCRLAVRGCWGGGGPSQSAGAETSPGLLLALLAVPVAWGGRAWRMWGEAERTGSPRKTLRWL